MGEVGERPRQSTSLTAASRSPASHLSLKEERLPAPPSRGRRAVHLQVPLGVNSKKNLRNFFLMDPFSSHFASYLSALSPSQTPLTVRHRVIRLSMGRKLWPWAQSERIWLSGGSGVRWATAKLQRRGPDKAFRGRKRHHRVSASVVHTCFSWCFLWPGFK